MAANAPEQLMAYILPGILQQEEAAQWQRAKGAPHPFRGAARDEWAAQQEAERWRQRQLGELDRWYATQAQQGQRLGQGFQQAVAPSAQIGYEDALRSNALNMAQRGMRGSSEDAAGQYDAQLRYAQALAEAQARASDMSRQYASRAGDVRQQMLGNMYSMPSDQMASDFRMGQLGVERGRRQDVQEGLRLWESFQQSPDQFKREHMDYSMQQVGSAFGDLGQNVGGWFTNKPAGGGTTPSGDVRGFNPRGGLQGAD